MATEYLVDSNVFIDLSRLDRDPLRLLQEWYGLENLVTCGMIRVEVLRGIRDQNIFDRFSAFMDTMVNVRSDETLWIESAALAWRLDRLGKIIPGTDAIIAASALRIGATVLTSDKHFWGIAGLNVVKPPEEWFS